MGTIYTTRYKTSDGKEFDWEAKAKAWQAHLDGDKGAWDRWLDSQKTPTQHEQDKTLDIHNQIVRYYNAGDWNGLINAYETDKTTSGINASPPRRFLYLIAKAIRDSEYEKAFEVTCFGKPTSGYMSRYNDVDKKFFYLLFDEAKKAWERKQGRAITDSELTQLYINNLEKEIVNDMKMGYKTGNGTPSYIATVECWEKQTGRQMSKEDEIRIAGKTFLKRGLFGKRK